MKASMIRLGASGRAAKAFSIGASIACLTAVGVLSACHREVVEIPQMRGKVPDFPPMSQSGLAYLRSLRPERAAMDARAAFAKGDLRFLGTYGTADTLPGMGMEFDYLAQKHGVRMIEGTSDMLLSGEYNRLNHNAETYATAYNTELMRLLPAS